MCAWSLVFNGITALGIIVLLWQVCLLKKQTKLSAFNSVLQQWGGEEDREARRHVHEEFEFHEGSNLEDLNPDSRKNVELVLATCDRTSFLAKNVPNSEKDIFEFVGHPMVRIWDKTEDFIKARRRRENKSEESSPGTYMYHFERFVIRNRHRLVLVQKEEESSNGG